MEFCRYLVEYGYEIIATEGTCNVLREAGIAALSAHELTGYPEPLGGKVRAMHPAVYTGIIANQLTPAQFKELGRAKAKVFPIEAMKLVTAILVALAIAAPTIKQWAAFQKRKADAAAARKEGR